MDNDIVNKIEALKVSMEEKMQSSIKLDFIARFFLTEEEIEEVSKLRTKQKENMKRLIDIMDFAIAGKSDKLEVECPDIDMVLLEMEASTAVVENTENKILNIYEAAGNRAL